MPIMYGEGYKRAFYRLQLEVFQAAEDYSLLAWQPSETGSGGDVFLNNTFQTSFTEWVLQAWVSYI